MRLNCLYLERENEQLKAVDALVPRDGGLDGGALQLGVERGNQLAER